MAMVRWLLLVLITGAGACSVGDAAGRRFADQDPARQSAPEPQSPPEPGTEPKEPHSKKERVSEPLFVPIVSSNPKVATSGGLLAAYAYQFDLESPPSRFGIMGQYSTTDSWFAGGFANTYWDADQNRLILASIHGEVRNDYADFLGTGLPAQTTDNLNFTLGRYLRKVTGPWYAGAQVLSSNYIATGENAFSQELLDLLGLTGFDSIGAGLVGLYDTRDNQYSTLEGVSLELHNVAYREDFGGDVDFDVLTAEGRAFLPHGERSTLGLHAKGRFTFDAPPSGFSSIELRGYVRGQYLAENSVIFEVEERWGFAERWGAAAFTGVGILFGAGEQARSEDNIYPNLGVGMFRYVGDGRMAARADYAWGTEGNHGFYLTFNQPF